MGSYPCNLDRCSLVVSHTEMVSKQKTGKNQRIYIVVASVGLYNWMVATIVYRIGYRFLFDSERPRFVLGAISLWYSPPIADCRVTALRRSAFVHLAGHSICPNLVETQPIPKIRIRIGRIYRNWFNSIFGVLELAVTPMVVIDYPLPLCHSAFMSHNTLSDKSELDEISHLLVKWVMRIV